MWFSNRKSADQKLPRPDPGVTAQPAQPGPAAASAATGPAAEPAGSSAPGFWRPAPPRAVSLDSYSGWFSGATGVEDALAMQKQTGSPVVLYFWADWCRYCKKFDENVLPDAEVTRTIACAVKARLEPDKGAAENALSHSYGVHGYPTVLLIPTPGSVPIRLSSESVEKFIESFRSQLSYGLARAAYAALQSGRLDDAIAHADRLIAFDPSWSQGYGYGIRGLAFRRKSLIADAQRDSDLACAAGDTTSCRRR
jgi:thiol-disulfide isomerase/thioredoxin